MAFDPNRTAFVKGEWGAEIVDALSPQEGDVVVEGKRGLDTEEHENAIKFDYPMFSDVMSAEEFTEQLQGAAVPAGLASGGRTAA